MQQLFSSNSTVAEQFINHEHPVKIVENVDHSLMPIENVIDRSLPRMTSISPCKDNF